MKKANKTTNAKTVVNKAEFANILYMAGYDHADERRDLNIEVEINNLLDQYEIKD